jgi:hypothetical protein
MPTPWPKPRPWTTQLTAAEALAAGTAKTASASRHVATLDLERFIAFGTSSEQFLMNKFSGNRFNESE